MSYVHIMFFTYIITNQRNGTLYIGHTDDLGRRMFEHKNKIFKGFASKYDLTRLVWFEEHESREGAFRRERNLKKWKRAWKLRLIEERNPDWIDIYDLSVWPADQDWSKAGSLPAQG